MRSKFKVGDIVTPKYGKNNVVTIGGSRIVFPSWYGNKLKFEVIWADSDTDLLLSIVDYNGDPYKTDLRRECSDGQELYISLEGFTCHYIDPNSVELYSKEALLKKFF